ncbi:hypothetical protein BDZ91DRAFT_800445 [Kalaharituber pfeilii]|nr:hypothetical protein BDZ91DRAFT_800445 [Kalaharituber pfeilii]
MSWRKVYRLMRSGSGRQNLPVRRGSDPPALRGDLSFSILEVVGVVLASYLAQNLPRSDSIRVLVLSKGLRAWRYHIGEATDPECRWCGEAEETTGHLLNDCRAWQKRWPGGMAAIRKPPKRGEGEDDPLQGLMEMLGEDGTGD